MKKLSYNIYPDISEEQYLIVEKDLVLIEKAMFEALRSTGWKLQKPVYNNDALIVDLIKKDNPFLGNMGIAFENLPGVISFKFYITKSFDSADYRYFLKESLFENKRLEHLKGDFLEYTHIAQAKFEGWTAGDIKMNGVKIDLVG